MSQNNYFNIKFEDNNLVFINQVVLPSSIEYITTDSVERIAEAIERLQIRGAPAIGVAAAYGLALSQKHIQSEDIFTKAYERLKRTRPTAVNLFWALNRVKSFYESRTNVTYAELKDEAISIHNEDIDFCTRIGINGLPIFKQPSVVLTHCNTGKLAVGGDGTAFNVIRTAFLNGLVKHVYADETRPLLQGSRLTAFELMQNEIPFSVITDSTAGYVMSKSMIDLAITGADRIARNGDSANKVGTYSVAVLCKYHNIPFYIAAPSSTIDLNISNGKEIPIEIRADEEVLSFNGTSTAPIGTKAFAPAFDVVPAELIAGIITEKGLFTPPYNFE